MVPSSSHSFYLLSLHTHTNYPCFPPPPQAMVSDNLGFGGHNAAIAFKRYDGPGK